LNREAGKGKGATARAAKKREKRRAKTAKERRNTERKAAAAANQKLIKVMRRKMAKGREVTPDLKQVMERNTIPARAKTTARKSARKKRHRTRETKAMGCWGAWKDMRTIIMWLNHSWPAIWAMTLLVWRSQSRIR
jgi:transcriptional regulator with AAA-type ATPase domain